MLNPLVWTGLLKPKLAVSNSSIELLSNTVIPGEQHGKAAVVARHRAARSTHTGRVFDGFARFPVAMVEEQPEGFRVLLIDYRFYRSSAGTALAAEIRLDPSLRVQSESMSLRHG